MNILTFNTSRMTQHEILGFLKRVNSILSTYPPDPDQPIGMIRINLRNAVKSFDDILKPPTRSEYTKQIQQLRIIRLDQWSGIRFDIKAKCKIADETISYPAQKANAIIDRYGNLRTITSVACDAAIDNILQDINNEMKEEELKKLNVNDWISLLTKTNQQYKDLAETRWESRQNYLSGKTREGRKQAMKSYYEFVNDMQYISRMGTEADQKSAIYYIESINSLIKEMKPILKSRATRSKKAKEKMESEKPEKDLIDILNEEKNNL